MRIIAKRLVRREAAAAKDDAGAVSRRAACLQDEFTGNDVGTVGPNIDSSYRGHCDAAATARAERY
jgi:hypothetical protein